MVRVIVHDSGFEPQAPKSLVDHIVEMGEIRVREGCILSWTKIQLITPPQDRSYSYSLNDIVSRLTDLC